MTPEALKQEILNGELNQELAPLVANSLHSQIADVLNDKRYTRAREVPIWEIKQYLLLAGKWTGILSSTDPVAVTVVDYFKDTRFDNLDTSLSTVQSMLTHLVDVELLSADDVTAVLALASIPASRVEVVENKAVSVGYYEVGVALAT